MSSALKFHIHRSQGPARLGHLQVRGRSTATPAFMPVGTAGTIKGVFGQEMLQLGYRAVLANTYHLHLRPGEAIVRELGGLHRFMGFPGVILTDSGGFQVFSLAKRCVLDADGVTFQSHLDGATLRLTPDRAMEIQHELDSDIAMVLDDCPAADAAPARIAQAVERSLSWAHRSLQAHRRQSQDRAVFAIVQGGRDATLRRQMAHELQQWSFDGYALGGISVGEDPATIQATVRECTAALPEASPRYLMGVGSPKELVVAVQSGIDLFDCVLPTRAGRTGLLFSRQGPVKIRNARYQKDPRPADADCPCLLCRQHSLGYLRHLFQAGEMLGPMLATRHNLTFFARLIADLRSWIAGSPPVDFTWLDRHYDADPSL